MNGKDSGRSWAFLSSKGGTGKTHVAINLAIQLAREGKRVLLIDADLGSANANFRIGVVPRYTLLDFYDGKVKITECVTRTEYGFSLIAGMPGEISLANLTDKQVVNFLRAFEQLVQDGKYDEIIFDLGAGISSRVLDFAVVSDEVVIIALPNEIIHAYATLKACWARFCNLQGTEYFKEKTDLRKTPYYLGNQYMGECGGPRINFIVNMVDNHAGGNQVYNRIRNVAKEFFLTRDGYWKLQMRYLGAIPDVHEFIKQAEKQRLPAVVMNPHHEFSYAIREITDIILERKHIAASRMKIPIRERIKSVITSWARR